MISRGLRLQGFTGSVQNVDVTLCLIIKNP